MMKKCVSRRIRKGRSALFSISRNMERMWKKSDHERSDSEGAGHSAVTLLEDGLRGSLVRFYYKCAFV